MIVEKIPEAELKMIDDYRCAFTGAETSFRMADARHILRIWETEKRVLYKMLGENLIVSKKISFDKSKDQLLEDASELTTFDGKGYPFISNYRSYVAEKFRNDRPMYRNLLELINDEALVTNIYEGDNIEVPCSNGVYKVHYGCKASKALRKLASIFNLSDYEEFRIAHSQILNQKHTCGEVCLSIHPLDYMTMSDNECGWSSCMSWNDDGGYRQGTVEMMNSPMVIVAYLKSEHDMGMPGHGTWSNKKWRQLFVVNHSVIASIKGYPYYNEELTKLVMAWIHDLAVENLGWNHFSEHMIPYNLEQVPVDGDVMGHPYSFHTGAMYNDFGALDHQWIYFSTAPFNGIHEDIYYSGKSECMWCGEVDADFVDESRLCCDHCDSTRSCDHCGDSYDYNDLISIDGYLLCSYCYDDHAYMCPVCGAEHHEDRSMEIQLVPDLQYSTSCYTKLICEECVDDFMKKGLIKGGKLYECNWGWNRATRVLLSDLNEVGLEYFDLSADDEELKAVQEDFEKHYTKYDGIMKVDEL